MTQAEKIDQIIQYSLLVAGEQDDYIERQLGPIHLVKYVYLADLAYAERREGETYTGVKWKFHKFGPWSMEVFSRIEPALVSINAHKKNFPSDYGNEDWVRWELRDERLLAEKSAGMPIFVTSQIQRTVKRFGSSTPDLLRFVYLSLPMTAAAPSEELDFSSVLSGPEEAADKSDIAPRIEALSNRKSRKLREGMDGIREKLRVKPPHRKKLINPVRRSADDGVFEQGVAWLDSQAGDSLPEGQMKVRFSDDIWHSDVRKGSDVP